MTYYSPGNHFSSYKTMEDAWHYYFDTAASTWCSYLISYSFNVVSLARVSSTTIARNTLIYQMVMITCLIIINFRIGSKYQIQLQQLTPPWSSRSVLG